MLQDTISRQRTVRSIKINSTIALLVALVLMCIVFGVLSPTFLSAANLYTITNTLAIVGISAIGMTLVLISGGVDLSVGSTAALTGAVVSGLWPNVLPIWEAVLVGLLAGTLVGLFNGLIITRLHISPLITTLATYSAVRGIAFLVPSAHDHQLNDPGFVYLGRGSIGGIPFSFLLTLVLYLVFYFVLRNSQFGRNLYAIGGSPEAARLAGININMHLVIAYVLCALLSSLSGLISSAQLAAGRPEAATGLEFTVIAAVVLGGTSLTGGKGTLIGTLIGVVLLRTLDNGLIQLSVSSFFQDVARGVVLLLTVGIDQLRIQWERARQRGT